MRPEDFDTDVVPTLLDVTAETPPADDPCGTADILAEIDEHERQRARVTYERGWRDFDRGGSHRVRRRRFSDLVAGNTDALTLWDAGWDDNQNGRQFGATAPTGF